MPPVPSVPGVDPKAMNALLLELAQRNAAAEALGMGNPYGSMLSVLQGSPQYKGMIETATRGAGLPFVEPESAAKARGTFPYDMAGKQYQAALDRATQQEKILGEAANDPAEIRVADGKGGFAIVQGTRAQKIRAAEGLPVPALGITGIFAPGSAGVAPAGSLAPTPYIDEIAKAQAGPQASGAEQRKTEAFQVAPGAVADPRMLPPGPGTTQPITLPNGTILPPAKLQPSTSGQSIVQTREEQKIDATQEGEWYKGIGSATFAENRLLAIADALKSFQSGQFQGNLADLRAKLSSVGIHVPDSFAGDPAKAQQILKDNFSASVEMMKSTGLSRWTQQELASAQTAMANPNLEPAANHSIIAQAVGAIRWERGMQDAYAQAKQYGWTKPNAFQLYYAQQNPLGPVVEQTKKELGPFKGMPQPPSPGTTYSPATEPRKLRWNPATGRAE
jgi:hypothetical protein